MSLAIQTELKDKAPAPAEGLEEKISVRHLNFFYGQYRALADINVNLYQNKVTAFIGPSGCGKSTLLRIINRIYDLYPNQRADGEVLLDGANVLSPKQDLNLLRAKVGMRASVFLLHSSAPQARSPISASASSILAVMAPPRVFTLEQRVAHSSARMRG